MYLASREGGYEGLPLKNNEITMMQKTCTFC